MISHPFAEIGRALCNPGAPIFATSLLLSWWRDIARNARAKVSDHTGARVATYPAALRAFAWGMVGIGILSAVVIARYGIAFSVAIMVLVFGSFAEFTRVRVEWTDAAVSVASPWSTPRRLDWDEIVEVTYSRSAAWFVVRGRSGVKIRLPNLLAGLGDLFDEMKRRGSDQVRGQIDRVTAEAWERRSGW